MTDPNHLNSESSESDDLNLVAFLKNNRPPVPRPHPQAEERLMQSIAQLPQPQIRRSTGKRGWLMGAIALSAAILGSILWQLRPQNSGVFAQREIELEAFLIESWQGISTDESLEELDWLPTQETISQTSPVSEVLAYQSHVEESHP